MGKTEVREPKQKRSIEKKNKIIETALILFCEKGFYNTNTAEIAKAAGVSTGIVYNYFTDKKEIFLEAINRYSYYMADTLLECFEGLDNINNIDIAINKILDGLLETHKMQRSAHEELEAMVHTDADVARFFINFENELCHKIADIMVAYNIKSTYIHEKVHIVYHMVENFCHEVVYHKHNCLDYNVMRQITVDSIKKILFN
ncbi:MAG: TetR/AcrR family transcriptional regulator [Clostridium sp.]|nr:TetR/AcrR family transcriptional regulator [Clostridium sp.]